MSTSGWNLQQGTIPFRPLSESEVIRIVNVALSPAKMHTTTYKYAFFKAVLDNLFNVNLESHFLDYDAIALRFTEIYWNLVLNFHLKQMPASQRTAMTAVERKLFDFCRKHGFDHSQKQQIFPFEALRSDLQLEIAKAIRREMLKYVVGAFYKDTEGQLYSFSKEKGGVHFNPHAYAAFVKDDKLWNFVLSCPACNSAKSNTLPAESYLADMKRRNLSLLNLDLPLVREDFKSYTHSKLEAMYRSALFNGFQSGWKPRTIAALPAYGFGDGGYASVADGE